MSDLPYGEFSREGLIDMLEEATERMKIAEHDVIALMGSLGHGIPMTHDGKLSDGTEPENALAKALSARVAELEAALAGQHETVCAYCRQVFERDDPNTILAHIQTCEKRPEKALFETWQRVENVYQNRLSLLVNASLALVDCHEENEDDDDGFTRWGDSETPVFLVSNERKRDEALHALMRLLRNGPQDGKHEETPPTSGN